MLEAAGSLSVTVRLPDGRVGSGGVTTVPSRGGATTVLGWHVAVGETRSWFVGAGSGSAVAGAINDWLGAGAVRGGKRAAAPTVELEVLGGEWMGEWVEVLAVSDCG